MAQQDGELTVAQRLGQLLDRGLLPAGGPAEAAERLIERLERPARIALLGLPGAGKSAVLNLLSGSVVVPENLRLPTIVVQHGSTERMICTLSDGQTQEVPGRDLTQVLTLNPALVTLELDLPALKVISLLEVSAGPMEAEQRRAAVWASKRADILIWCTTSYLPKEQQVWEGMPDTIKDNGFLFLTKVDLLGSREAARGMLERVELRAGEEFRQVLSLSAKQARQALQAPGGLDHELFRDSGAAAMISTIKTRVQMARRADTDMAELLLARHVEASGIVAKRFAEPEAPARPDPEPEWRAPPEPQAAPAAVRLSVVPGPAPAAEGIAEPEPEAAAEGKGAETPPAEPVVTPEPEPVAEPVEPVVAAVVPEAEPEPEPAPVAPPEPVPPPVSEPLVVLSRAADPSSGRKRFADRIKAMPMPEDAAVPTPPVPLRTTWKSKTETAAPAVPAAPAEPPRPAARVEPPEPVIPDPAAAEPVAPEPEVADLPVVAPPAPEPEPVAPEPVLAGEPVALPEAGAAEPDAQDAEAEAEDGEEPETGADDGGAKAQADADDARIARMLAAVAAAPTVERSARTSLFGARKAPAAPAPGEAGARPAERVARPTEPVTRVRAPAPRPADPPKPAAPLPEDLAKPRLVPAHERRPDAEGIPAPRTERRERPRIAARVAAAAPRPVEAVAAVVPAAERDLIESTIALMISRSAALATAVAASDKVPVDLILGHVRATTEQAIEILSRATSPELRRINGDLGEVLDLVMLMQLEKGHAPADDAITLVLQIRRDLETLRPA
jgi:hypothetical protein